MSLSIVSKFVMGSVVIETEPNCDNNPGHVIGFAKTKDEEVLVRVQFANGDRYNCSPTELTLL